MSRESREPLLELKVEKLVPGGRGFSRTPAGVVFIEGALPGERILGRVLTRKRDYLEAEAFRILDPSPDRADPFCSLYGICGGCNLQHLQAVKQAGCKTSVFRETLERVGGVVWNDPLPVLTGATEGCRVRARFQTGGGDAPESTGRLGFFGRKSDRVVIVECCPLLVPRLNDLLAEYYPGMSLDPAAAAIQPTARQRYLQRTGSSRTRNRPRVQRGLFAAANGTRYALDQEPIELSMLEKVFQTAPSVFFQSHPELFGRLLVEMLAGIEGKRAVDLYSGVGTIAAFLADRFEEVTAVEQEGACLAFARLNLPSRVSIAARSVEAWSEDIPDMPVDLVTVDPPRTGMSERVVQTLLKLRPDRLLSISCNPVTFSRDLKRLLQSGAYRLEKITAADLYPHTDHLEAAGLLVRIS